jgi:hypothetical protein
VNLLEARRSGSPLALVGAYAVGLAATIAWVGLLPGEPSYEGPARSGPVAAGLGVIVVFFLARGSRSALVLARFAHVLGLLYSVVELGGAGITSKVLGLAILQALVVLVLFSPALERFVYARR